MRDLSLTFGRQVRAALIGGSFAVALATASLAAPALAADQPTTTAVTADAIGPHTHQIHGVVKGTPASGATSFVVTTERYGDVTVTFSSANNTKGHGHAQGHTRSLQVMNGAALKDGDRVVVQGRTSSDGKTFIARRVHVLPAEGAVAHPAHVVGTIAAVSTSNGNTNLTITPTTGSASQTVTIISDTRIRPDAKTAADLTVGTKVTVISKNGTATGVVFMTA